MRRSLPFVLLPVFVVLALCYAYAIPIYESPDETTHFGFVHYVAERGALPVQDPVLDTQRETWYEQEGSQPPLYYLIAGTLIRALNFDRSDFDATRQPNPHAIIGNPTAQGNQNSVLHDLPYPPRLTGTTGAVFAARMLSIALGCVTVFAVYRAAGVFMPGNMSVPLLAAGLVAFNPQFLFIAASVNNDNLVTALNSLVIWQMLVMVRDGYSTRRSLILALLIACASLSKLSGLVLIPVVGVAGLWTAFRSRDIRGLIRLGVLIVGVWVIMAGWWYLRNWTLYGEWFGTQTMLDIFGRRPAPPLLDLIQNEFAGLRISFWGLFGWFNVFTHPAFYAVMDILTLIAFGGLIRYGWRIRRDHDQGVKFALLSLAVVLGLISLILWTMQTAASQGRLMFSYIAAIAILLAVGLRTWRIPALVVIAPLAAFAAVVPFATIMPTYAPPASLDSLPAHATPIYKQFRDWALIGYTVDQRRYMPGDDVPITLYWQPIRNSDGDFSLFIRLIDPQDGIISALPTYPGYGRLRTTTWASDEGAIYPDHYRVRIPTDASGVFALRAYVGWWKFPEGYSLDPVDSGGNPTSFAILDVGGFVGESPPPIVETMLESPVDFGGVIRLIGYTFDESAATLDVLWESSGDVGEHLTVFAHGVEPGTDALIAQADAPPALQTRYWRAGERYITRHTFGVVPESDYAIFVGWYSPDRPYRLPVAAPDNAYLLFNAEGER